MAAQNPSLAWQRDLPEDWEIAKLKRVVNVRASNVDKLKVEGEQPVRLCNYTDVYYSDYITAEMDFMEATATVREIDQFQLRGGEVLLTKDSETAEDIAIPAYVSEQLSGVLCGYHLYVLRPSSKIDGRFLFRACSVSPVRDQFVTAANGITRYGLGQQALGASYVPIPPVEQQRTIANFLDRETAKIDALIDKKQRLIELLQEKRSALITEAVTRGLDPNVELKDSGVEWLGEIPAHWEAISLKHGLLQIEQGWSPQCETRQAGEDEYGVLKVGCVNGWQFRPSEHKALPSDVQPKPEYEVREGDVLLSRANTRDLLGSIARVGKVRKNLLFSDKLYRLVLDEDQIDGEFLVQFVSSRAGRFEFERDATGASGSMQNISQEAVRELGVLRPPLTEQRKIRDFLAREHGRLDSLTDQVRELIGKLQEYRTALISAAVTGKIDLRETAA